MGDHQADHQDYQGRQELGQVEVDASPEDLSDDGDANQEVPDQNKADQSEDDRVFSRYERHALPGGFYEDVPGQVPQRLLYDPRNVDCWYKRSHVDQLVIKDPSNWFVIRLWRYWLSFVELMVD